MRHKNSTVSVLFLALFQFVAFGQKSHETQAPDYLKTIVFKAGKTRQQFPIIRLGESIHLQFDDLLTYIGC